MKKFLFDARDFEKEGPGGPKEKKYTEDDAEQFKQQAFTEGKNTGQKEAQQSQEQMIAQMLNTLSQKVTDLIGQEEEREVRKNIESVRLILRAVHTLMPKFLEKHALMEVERTITESLQPRRDEPRLAVTVPTQHLEALKTRIDSLAEENGFAGHVVLIADDSLGISDCRIEWADGGIERNYENIYARIENAFTQSLYTQQDPLEDPVEPEPTPEQ